MSDTFVAENDAPEHDDVANADEASRYEEMEKRFDEGDEPEGDADPEPNWKEQAEKAEKRFQDQQRRAKAERREKQALAKRLEELETKLNGKQGGEDDFDLGNEDDDPIGTIKSLKKLAERMREQEAAEKQTAAQQQAEQKRVQGLAKTLQDAESDFRRLKPDYDKAVEHLKKARREELIEEGYDEGDIGRVMTKEFLDLIERSEEKDRDPAEVVYALAMKRGYSLDAGKKKLQDIADSQKAGRSLSSAGGRNGDGSQMTYARAGQLKGPALMKAFAQLKDQEKRASRR